MRAAGPSDAVRELTVVNSANTGIWKPIRTRFLRLQQRKGFDREDAFKAGGARPACLLPR